MRKTTIASFVMGLIAVALVFFVLLGDARAQDKAAKVDEYMRLCHEYGQFNGAVLVAEEGDVIYRNGFGLANMEWNIPNQPNTKFRIASITKQFTAMLIMQLVEERKLRLDGTVAEYLPDYRNDTGEKVTIHHLLTHTSGIPNYTREFWSKHSRIPYPTEDMVSTFCSGDLEYEPGSTFRYSNAGYFLLGYIIEQVTGKPFGAVLREKILEPLGMYGTGLDRDELILEGRASGHGRGIDGFVNAPYVSMQNVYAAGGMYSTVEDLYVWDQALYTGRLLSEKYRDMMFTPFLGDYAYGWGVSKIQIGSSSDSTTSVAHSGGIEGFTSKIVRLVDDGHLIVLFNNTGGARLNEMCEAITGILYGAPYDPPKKSVAEMLVTRIEKEGVQSAIEYYHRLRKSDPDTYDFGEDELNRLGYQLIGSKDVDEAIEIFKLNVAMYPEAWNPYDSLGEAYMMKGEKDLAIKNYAKSLELNPKNANALEMLNKMSQAR